MVLHINGVVVPVRRSTLYSTRVMTNTIPIS